MGDEVRNQFSGISHGPVVQVGSISGDVHINYPPVLTGAASERPMMRRLDFDGYLEQKRRNFSGRRWLFDRVQSWRQESAERALLITGDPGSGKSSFIAELARRTSQDELLAFYFCVAEDRGTLDPAALVMHLAAMIADRLPAYAELLGSPEYCQLLKADAVSRDPGQALDQGIIALLRQLPVARQRLILVDGLDETLLAGDPRESILALLVSRLDRFPEWIKIVLTARPDPQVLTRLGEVRVVEIDVQQAENLNDVRELVANHLSGPAWCARLAAAGMSAAEAQSRLTADARGNLLYVTMVLKSIELGRYSLSELGNLPPGLAGIYQLFFERLIAGGGSYEPVRGLLEVMVAAQAPIPTGILQATSGLDGAYGLPATLTTLSTLMSEEEGCHSFFHQSFAGWLVDQHNSYRADAAMGHARLARGFLDHLHQPAGDFQVSPPTGPVFDYWVTYGLDHLGHSGESLPSDLAPAAFAPVAVSAQKYIYALGTWTKDLPASMRFYVQRLLHDRRFGDVLTLLRLLKGVAMFYYVHDGLVRERVEDGGTVYEIGSEATDGPTVFSALKVTGFAGAIVRAAKISPELALTVDQIALLLDELRILRYMAGGFEVACWADGISRSFEDVGGCLYRELSELADGR